MANSTTDTSTQQYLRQCSLVVYNSTLNGIDLSALRIKFSIKRTDSMTPNVGDIRVYNLAADTAAQIKQNFEKGSVILQAGYPGNVGVIFKGNIKQVILGRESATDTFIDIIAADGDLAYNNAIVNTTIASGATQSQQVNASIQPMTPLGVTAGNVNSMPPTQLPRGKVMYGEAKKYLRATAKSTTQSWSIQDGKVVFVPNKGFLPGSAVVLTSVTGMIGTPQQTTYGINIKCLLNPNIKINTRVQIDNKSIQKYKIDLSITDATQIANSIPAPINADGVYYVLVANHTGDTRGVEWYTDIIAVYMDITTNPANSVLLGAGGGA